MYAQSVLIQRISLLLMALLGLGGCKKNTNTEAFRAGELEEEWLVSGRLVNDDFGRGKILAFNKQGERFENSLGPDNSFTLGLPGNETFAVYFFPHGKSTTEASSPALLTFEGDTEIGMRDTLRLPEPTPTGALDLGIVAIKGDYAYPATNPSTKLDFDRDGIPDSQDHDDENDGLPDASQNAQAERISICHEKQSIDVSLPTLLSHLNHHDEIGPCDSLADNSSVAPSVDAMTRKNGLPNSWKAPSDDTVVEEALISEEEPDFGDSNYYDESADNSERDDEDMYEIN